MSLVAANRYAKALAELATDPKTGMSAEAMVEQMNSMEQALIESPELRGSLLSPAVQASQKRAVVGRLAGPLGLSPLMRNFMFVLIDHRRIPLLSEIRRSFTEQIDERLGIARAEVSSAAPLSAAQREALETQLKVKTGLQVRCAYREEAALVGGASVQVGSTIYDGSVRGQLDALRRRLSRPA
jgi:F-type H+-transporting ATPase subunit delta